MFSAHCVVLFYRLRKGGITVVLRRAVGMCSPSAAPTVPAVSPRTKPSRSLSSGTSWRLQPWETSQRPVSSTVSGICPLFWHNPKRRLSIFVFTWQHVLISTSPVCRLCSLCFAQALCEAALLCQLCHPQQGGEEPLLWGQERPNPSTPIQARCKYNPPHLVMEGKELFIIVWLIWNRKHV